MEHRGNCYRHITMSSRAKGGVPGSARGLGYIVVAATLLTDEGGSYPRRPMLPVAGELAHFGFCKPDLAFCTCGN